LPRSQAKYHQWDGPTVTRTVTKSPILCGVQSRRRTEPREHVQVDPGVRGGEPVIAGTRIPYDEVAALLRDGVEAEDIGEFFPQVSPDAARDAYDFASYVDNYVQPPERAA
jgi:uncharacterized protein (DUF433 family)